ncbi:MAG TPA: hypothetical protein VFH82_05840, partial [Gemmatimonadota bacterium]|nr:hypothetical protein [Gemmatimonadota bacterium]
MMESAIVAILVKATVVLLVAFALTALLRGASAAARHAVWSAALVGVIAVPALTMVLPWRMDVLPSGWGSSRPGTAAIAAAGELADTPMPTPTPTTWSSDVGTDQTSPEAGVSSDETTGAGISGRFSGLARDPWRLALFAWLAIA